mmetsp:Transcript_27139/g.65991  ORF Transcript_27139/g.65991 Transcript_27139/m.65991 type:complete len:87 (+) Transcript_27139:41-301(+)
MLHTIKMNHGVKHRLHSLLKCFQPRNFKFSLFQIQILYNLNLEYLQLVLILQCFHVNSSRRTLSIPKFSHDPHRHLSRGSSNMHEE